MTTLTITALTVLADDWHDRWNGDGPPFPVFLFPLFWLLVVAAVVTTWLLTRRSREAAAGRRSGEQVLAESVRRRRDRRRGVRRPAGGAAPQTLSVSQETVLGGRVGHSFRREG